MTQLINEVFEKVSNLPPEIQDEIAVYWSDDLESEFQWDSTLEQSSDKLEILAAQAMDDYEKGKTIRKGFDEL